MRTRLLPIIIALSFLSLNAIARELTPIESFVYRMKQTNTFAPVSGIWQADNNYDKAPLYTYVEDAQPLTINYDEVAKLLKSNPLGIELTIPGTDGKIYTIELGQYNILGNNFQVHAIGANKSDGLLDYTPGLYYRGIVKGYPGSLAAFSFFKNEVYGIFSIPGVGNINVVPNTLVGKPYNYNQSYLLFNDKELKLKDKAPKCFTSDEFQPDQLAGKTTTTLNSKVLNTCSDIRVFEVGDYSLFLSKGSSATNVTNYLTAVFNNKAAIYRNEDLSIALNYVEVDTVPDVYYSVTTATSRAFLKVFSYTTQNTLHNCDLALLASTKFSAGYGALGGVAWLATMCSRYNSRDTAGPYGYCNMDDNAVVSFPTYSWNVEVMAHEMGHIVGSPHTHACCWNPSGTGTTAIDGCYTMEGSCTPPGVPSAGGTIMSYCHLTSVGINFSFGFGTQPGDTVRYFTRSRFGGACGGPSIPDRAIATANRTVIANRECYDVISQNTFYWNDNNTASTLDDTLVLMIKKNGNNIGNMNDTGFQVLSGTNVMYGRGSGQRLSLPSGIPGVTGTNYSMRRYWKMTPKRKPRTPVEVSFPYTRADSADVNGSLSSLSIGLSRYQAYKTDSSVDPNPANGFVGATAANFQVYSFGSVASPTKWTLGNIGATQFATILTSDPTGGGSLFLSSNYFAGVDEVTSGGGYLIAPNPTNGNWFVSIVPGNEGAVFELYTADGRLLSKETLTNKTTEISAQHFASGMYIYRFISGNGSYTGTLVKH